MTTLKAKLLILFLSCFLTEAGALTAGFNVTTDSGCAPLAVNFNDVSVPSTGVVIRTWDYDFNDGGGSNLSNPKYIFTNPGTYVVTLTVYDGTSSSSFSKTIIVFKLPKADFSIPKTDHCPFDSVLFTNKTKKGDTSVAFFTWDFGDGTILKTVNPLKPYSFSGLYDVKLSVKDFYGCENIVVKSKFINIFDGPRADFAMVTKYACASPQRVTLTNKSSSNTISYLWDMKDGTTANSTNMVHDFIKVGNYKVSLTAMTSNGCKHTKVVPLDVLFKPLKSDFSAQLPAGCLPFNPKFRNLSTPAGSNPDYEWDFGDGTKSFVETPTKIYTVDGTYKVKLKISGIGCSDSVFKTVTASANPESDLRVSKTLSCNMKFASTFYAPGTDIVERTWKIDGKAFYSTSSDTVRYAFKFPKIYKVTVHIRNKIGCESTLAYPDVVYQEMNGGYETGSQGGCKPITLNLNDTSKFQVPTTYTLLWDNGYGVNYSIPKFNVTFRNEGIYDVKLLIKDTFGCEQLISKPIPVGRKLKPSFRMNKTSVCNNEYVRFYNTSPDSVMDNTTSWFWEVKTNTGEQRDSFFTKLKAHSGTISPMLVSNFNSCKDTAMKQDSLTLLAPLAEFTYKFDSCYTSWVRIIMRSRGITSFSWQLPDKSSSLDTQVRWKLHGDKDTFTMFVYNRNTGCADTTKEIIEAPSTVSAIHVHPVPGQLCTPQPFVFDNSRIMPSRTHWDFGDGDTTYIPDPYNWLRKELGGFDHKDTFMHIYTQPGTYIIQHTGWNRFSCPYSSRDTILVKGPSAASRVWPLQGCLPLTIHLQDSASTSFSSKVMQKYWKIDQTDSFPASDKDSVINYTIKRMPGSGDTFVRAVLYVLDSNGCRSSRTYKIRPSFPKGTMSVNRSIDCANMKFTLGMTMDSALTTLPVTFEWKMGDGHTYHDEQIEHVYETSGKYVAKLKITDALGCVSNEEVDIKASHPQLLAKFMVINSHSICPPLTAQFRESSIIDPNNTITDYQWFFGDGSGSGFQHTGKLYELPGDYTVSLVVRDSRGCTDTTTVRRAVHVGGPKGRIRLGPVRGCLPLIVNFSIKDPSISFSEWNFGNGKTIVADSCAYTYTKAGLYLPKVIIKDSGGCTVIRIPEDTIMALGRPKSVFSVNSYCLDDSIRFSNQSFSGNFKASTLSYRWQLLNNVYDQQLLTHKFDTASDYLVSLTTGDSNHCYDTMTQHMNIAKPVAGFSIGKTQLCHGDSIAVWSTSSSKIRIKSTEWWIDDVPSDITGYFPGTGDHDISMMVMDSLNCRDTFTGKAVIHVADTLSPGPIQINYVSMRSDHDVEISFQKTMDMDFRGYTVYHFDGTHWSPLQHIHRKDSVNAYHTFGNPKSSHCYKVTQTNYCKSESELDASTRHCSIHTHATPGLGKNLLDWNAYEGWRVNRYNIYRQNLYNASVFDSIDMVDGLLNNYTDTGIRCNTLHAYQVQAVGMDSIQRSYSDSGKAKAIWLNQLPAPQIAYVTVDKDTAIQVKLKLNPKYVRSNYSKMLLYRYHSSGLLVRSVDLMNPELTDRRMGVDANRYFYSTRVTDDCGDTSAYSASSSNILVRSITDHTLAPPTLSWNHYSKWSNGVKQYEVQRMTPDGVFETLQLTNDSFYEDVTSANTCMKQYRYRVIASEQALNAGDTTYSSTSNEIHAKPRSAMFIPNAFTPDHNGINEIFVPKGQYVYNYKIEIYNRWGERIYDNDACFSAWDGTYKNEPAEAGLYYYKVSAFGNDGQAYSFKGVLTLLR